MPGWRLLKRLAIHRWRRKDHMSDTKYEPADIEVYIKNKGLVLRERSLIAYQHSDGKILAVGTEAEQKRDGVVVVSPLRRGMIADYRYRCFVSCWSGLGENGAFGSRISLSAVLLRILQMWKRRRWRIWCFSWAPGRSHFMMAIMRRFQRI